MIDVRNQQVDTTVLMADCSHVFVVADQTEVDWSEGLDPGCVIEDSDNDSVSPTARNVTNEIEKFIRGMRQYFKNFRGEELSTDEENEYRELFSDWTAFMQPVQGEQWPVDNKINRSEWLPRWNMFLQVRAGEKLVTWWNVCLSTVGFIFYIVDLVSDIGTSMYYASNGQWWRAMVTLAIVYGAVIIHTVIKWYKKQIHCTGAADWLRYVGSLLVNWPDVKQYGALCLLEWKLYISPANSAHLVAEWHQRRVNVAYLKFTEGFWEACPQAILQLCFLVPDLYGDWTWTDYLRIAGASVSLCTAGAALVNWEKFSRIKDYTDLPLSELVVLHVWTVPVTVSRLLSVTLLLSVHPYWALAGVTLHLVLHDVYWWRAMRGHTVSGRTLYSVNAMCVNTMRFFMSPFFDDDVITNHRMSHAIHLLGNTAATVVWALGTPLMCAHPVLYTTIICFNAVTFAVGLVGWQLYEKYWLDN